MSMVDREGFRKKMEKALEGGDAEAGMSACMELESQILLFLNKEFIVFSTWELPSIVAALDRYKSIVLDVAEQRGVPRSIIQKTADDLNEATRISYTHVVRREQINGEH